MSVGIVRSLNRSSATRDRAMNESRKRAETFLKEYGIHLSCLDPGVLVESFMSEMEKGLAGEDSSLAMIPTFIDSDRPVPKNEPVIVIDAGGTNLRACSVVIDEHSNVITENFAKRRMPGIDGQLSADQFYTELCDFILPVVDCSDRIGFCFSYPVEILPSKDGKLLHWTKEVDVPEVVGTLIGEGLLSALFERGHSGKQVVILNDTVATLLAGKTRGEQRKCSSYIGYILGTGTNTAYVELNSNITKRDDLSREGHQIINTESGGFGKVVQGEIDIRFDSTTNNPGSYAFEKMISGGYMGPLGLELLKVAVEDGILSQRLIDLAMTWDTLTTKDMDDFLGNPFLLDSPFADSCIDDADREMLVHLFSGIVERAALLSAVNISASVLKSGQGRNPLYPVCINIDGSTFHKTNWFKSKVEGYLRTQLLDNGIYYELVSVDSAPVIGAAIAGLTS